MTEENYNYRTSQKLLRNQFPGKGKLKIPIIPKFQESPGDFDDLYLYRQIDDKKVRETIDFLLNREEAHNQMFRDAFNEVQDSGSNRDFGTTKAAKMYFSLSNPGPNTFAGNEVSAPKFD